MVSAMKMISKTLQNCYVIIAMLFVSVMSLFVFTFMYPNVEVISGRYQIPSTTTNSNFIEKEIVNLDSRKLGLRFVTHSTIKMTSNMTARELDVNFFRYTSTLHFDCEDYIRLGHSYDGGWDMCLVGPFRPTKPCLIYSFGIAWDFSFDDAASIRFGCTVRSFDPSMNAADHRRGANIWFYRTGIGGKDEKTSKGWTLKTLQTIIMELNDTAKTIDYLKMDVEHAEWECVPNMISAGVLDQVKQFGMEIHVTSKDYYRFWTILNALEERGFRRWFWTMNFRGNNLYMGASGSRSYCYEMVYINTKYLKTGYQ